MPSRRPQPLSRERIVDAALALVERAGLESLTMRKLGLALGREAMSLYHFFPSKRHLLDALVDHAIASVEFAPGHLPAIERLRFIMRSYRAMAHRHARLYPLIGLHRLNTPTGVRFIERILQMVREVEGDDERAARTFRTVGYYLMGAAMDETMGYAQGPSAAEPVDGAFIARECPQLARSARWFQRSEWDATFELGLEQLMAGLQETHEHRPKGAPGRLRKAKSK
jgi:AcrR family transcriptional regulator